jgi:protein-S-isoprenylcysteine O-methyltransferase Ste14
MTIAAKIAVFIFTSAILAFVTRRSLRSLHSHGLYRLLAWSGTIALVLLNLEAWFNEPFTAPQIVSWVLLALSVATVSYGFVSLRRGRPDDARGDDSLIGVEKTTQLVTTRAYRYVRHPMYSSFLLAAVGICLKDISWAGTILTAFIFVCATLTAKSEEKENTMYFGETYRSYMQQTRMFIPFLW